MIAFAPCTRYQLGMLAVRVNWVNQCMRVHLKVNQPKKTSYTSDQPRPSSQLSLSALFCTSIMHSSSQYCSWEYHHCSRTWYFAHSYLCEFDRLVYRCYRLNIKSNLCLYRWMLYASVEFLSSFSSLWWPWLVVETRQHQPGQPIANFTISVDMCTVDVRISAGNSAGMSAPSNTIEIGKYKL